MTPNPTYQCPHCGTAVQVTNPAALNDLITCPADGCGKPFKVEVPTAAPIAEPAVAAAVPVEPTPTPAGERVAPCLFRRYPLRYLGYAALALAGLGLFFWGMAVGQNVLGLVGAAAAGWAGYRLTAWWLRTSSTSLVVGPESCVLETGLMTRQRVEVRREDVKEVVVEQGFAGRLFDVGDVVVTSDAGEKSRLVLYGVPDPHALADRLRTPPPAVVPAEAPAEAVPV